jgi:hypothetical protein
METPGNSDKNDMHPEGVPELNKISRFAILADHLPAK